MSSEEKCIITAALAGSVTRREHCAAIPYTPEEMGVEARRAVDAGAAIVHIHARTPEGDPDWTPETFGRIKEEIDARCDVLINFSTGAAGVAREERINHVAMHRPDIAALNMGSMNYAIYSERRKEFVHDYVFANPFGDIRFFLEAMIAAGVRPEMECFDAGHIANHEPLVDLGLLQPPMQFSLVMGVLGGIPGTVKNLVRQVEALPREAQWQVIGIGAAQWPLVAAAIALGGDCRVGLEDNFYVERGRQARSNGELVEKAATMARLQGREPATVAEARSILGLPERGAADASADTPSTLSAPAA